MGSLVQRIIKMLTKPREYWEEMVGEPGDIRAMMPRMLILALLPAVAWVVGIALLAGMRSGFMGLGIFGRWMAAQMVASVLMFVMGLGSWVVFGYIIDALAPSFGAQKDLGQAMKLATVIIPSWLGQTLAITSFSALAYLGVLGGLGFGAYLLYIGLPIMNGTPEDKAAGFAAAAMGCLLGVMLVVSAVMCVPASCCMASAFLGARGF